MPTVSVVMASYNHACYVSAAIRSVLSQTNVDLEFLVADDGSSDETAAAIRAIRDPRMVFEAFDVNRGAAVVLNELVARARGEFVAVMNSDDIWLRPDKLELQVQILSSEPNLGATFGRATFIDKNGVEITGSAVDSTNVFDQQNRSQSSWLRRFFEEGNCLCHPTVLIRRSIFAELGSYDPRLRQLPDFDMWVRLVKKYPIHVSSEKMIGFRILPGENASAPTFSNGLRTINEHFLIVIRFFKDFRLDLFRDAFQSRLVFGDVVTELDARIECALLMLNEQSPVLGAPYQVAGLIALNELLGEPDAQKVLREKYDIDEFWFHKKTGSFSVLQPFLLEQKLHAAMNRGEVLEKELQGLEGRLRDELGAAERNAHLQAEVGKLLEDVHTLTENLNSKVFEIVALRESSSWRITRPLRELGTIIRRLRSRPN